MKNNSSEKIAFGLTKCVFVLFMAWMSYVGGRLVVLEVVNKGQLVMMFSYIFFFFISMAGLVIGFIMEEKDLGNLKHGQWENLAPKLCRQIVLIEAITDHCILEDEMKQYLVELSKVLGMKLLAEPVTHPAEQMGYGGWVHWVTSGSHAYSYTKEVTGIGKPLISIIAYTCKPFSIEKAVVFTREYFKTEKIVWKEV